jgi:hypothetical protein
MLKTRSLFPHYGKVDFQGKHCSQFALRTYDGTWSNEKQMRYWHEYGSVLDYYSFVPGLGQGLEKFRSTENYYQPNECYHLKVERQNLPYTTGKYVNWGYGWRIALNLFCRWTYDNAPTPVVADFEATHWGNYGKVGSGLRAEAYWTMRPKFEGEVSMLNFLFELKDFRDISNLLVASKKNPLWELMTLDTTIKGLYKALKKDKLSTPTKRLAEAHLINSFAIVPLISDLKAIFSQLHGMIDEAQAKFAKNGEGTTRHFSAQLDPVASPVKIPDSQAGYEYWIGDKYSSKFTATASMKYKYRLKDGFDKQAAYWGLGLTAEALWNALPFSFLVDYFLSVGKALKCMRTDKDVSEYTINEYQESVLTTLQRGRFIANGPTPSNEYCAGLCVDDQYIPYTSQEPQFIDGWSVSCYTRSVRMPYAGPVLPKFRVPKGSQLINMAALARCFI